MFSMLGLRNLIADRERPDEAMKINGRCRKWNYARRNDVNLSATNRAGYE
jgi:hypothetical protein